MTIAVFGSINMDLVARTNRLPKLGETLTGYAFQTFPGGKGANQAVACARLGASTYMVGRVGADVFGSRLKVGLETAGVDHKNVRIDGGVSSGVALIAVEDSAENMIIVVPGANGQVNTEELKDLRTVLDRSKILLMQLEIPLEMVVSAAKIGKENEAIVILDPAPAQVLPEELYPFIDVITPNQTEAELLAGFQINSQEDAARAAEVLKDRGVEHVIIKMGGRGAFALIEEKGLFIEAFNVTAIDTVAAGDAFNGALAVALSEGKSILNAIEWGMAGGALSVTKEGAQPAMPNRDELTAFLIKSNRELRRK